MDNRVVYDIQENKECVLLQIFQNIKSLNKYILGYYNIELIKYINETLKKLNHKAIFYGDNCTMLIQ